MTLTSLTELLIIITRWVHISSAVIWVGGGMFYLIAIRPINHMPNKNLNDLIKLINKTLDHNIKRTVARVFGDRSASMVRRL